MGILDWFKNRPAQFDPDNISDVMVLQAIEKAITLTNPRLKIVRSYQGRLAPSVKKSVGYLRELVLNLNSTIRVSEANWSFDPALRAFFVAPTDIPRAIGRSNNLRILFEKYPGLDEACFILGMTYNEQRMQRMSLQGDIVQRDVEQTFIGFSEHQVRICGHEGMEVRRLLGAQMYEYLVAQALSEIGEDRTERRELEDNRALIRARLRLFQQQGPGLGSVFGLPPSDSDEQLKLETQLLGNERQLEALGSPQSSLDKELECLREVLEHPERYIQIEQKQLRLSTMNVVLDDASTDVASDIGFSLVQLRGIPEMRKAFVLATYSREEMPEDRIDFEDAERYL